MRDQGIERSRAESDRGGFPNAIEVSRDRGAGRLADAPLNVAAYLPRMAAAQPETRAVVVPAGCDAAGRARWRSWTYQELNSETARLARGFESIGIQRGMRVIVLIRPGFECFATIFALFNIAAVPVIIDPGMGMSRMANCLGTIGAEAFIGNPFAHILRLACRRHFRSIRINVTVGRRWFWSGHELSRIGSATAAHSTTRVVGSDSAPADVVRVSHDETAAILFTTGSTGPAKPVVYTHGVFAAQFHMLRDTFNIRPGEVDLATFLLFGLFAPGLGMASVLPDMNFTKPGQADPRKIIEAITDNGVTNMFGSPALLDRVGRFAAERDPSPPWGRGQGEGVNAGTPPGVRINRHTATASRITLPTLRRVITAGAPVRRDILERFSTMLTGDAEIFTPYGATEALPVACIGSRELLSEPRPAHQNPERERRVGSDERAGSAAVQLSKIQDPKSRIPAQSAIPTPQSTVNPQSEIRNPQWPWGVCVGRPLPGIDLRIIRITDDPIDGWSDDLLAPPGEIGEIAVRGPIVTREYFANPQTTALAKIPLDPSIPRSLDPMTSNFFRPCVPTSLGPFFHRMGDVGCFDDRGRLWMCGRKSHRVESEHGTLFTIPCEAVFNQHPRVRRTALVGVPMIRTHHAGGGTGDDFPSMRAPGITPRSGCGPNPEFKIQNPKSPPQRPVLCVEIHAHDRRRNLDGLTRELLALGAAYDHTRTIRTILYHPRFPVDIRHNAKIFREKLAIRAAKRAK